MSPVVRPRDVAGKTGCRIAAEELAELVAVEANCLPIPLSGSAGPRLRASPSVEI